MKKLICLILVTLSINSLLAQISPSSEPSNGVKSASPQISSLGTYDKANVSLSTGTPNITIPLGEVTGHGFSMPISLDYNARGVKHDDVSSWVGLSWNINTGGFISRNVVGAPDEFPNGFWNFESNLALYNSGHVSGQLDENDKLLISGFKNMGQNSNQWPDLVPVPINLMDEDTILVDSKPDVFSFNFNGYSGEFIILKSGNTYYDNQDVKTSVSAGYKILMLSKQDLKIEVFGVLDSFHVTTPDGIKYSFTKKVSTYFKNYYNTRNHDHYMNAGAIPLPDSKLFKKYYTSSWLLTRVELTNHEEVNFEYAYKNISVNTRRDFNLKKDEVIDVFDNPFVDADQIIPPQPGTTNPQDVNDISNRWRYSHSIIQIFDSTFRVSKIISRDNTVEFLATANPLGNPSFCTNCPRKDLSMTHHFVNNKDVRLNEIVFKTNNGDLLNKWNFDYGYFMSNVLAAQPKEFRLRLDKLTQTGKNSISNPPYKFKYNATNVAVMDTRLNKFGHDWWGYYNGVDNSAHSDLPGYDVYVDTKHLTLAGNNREPENDPNGNYDYMKAYSLEEIEFPTGGKRIFEFEPHDYGYVLDKKIDEKDSQPVRKFLTTYPSAGGTYDYDFTIYQKQRFSLKARLRPTIFKTDITYPNTTGPFAGVQPNNAQGDNGQYFCHGFSYLMPINGDPDQNVCVNINTNSTNPTLNLFDINRHKAEPFANISKQYPYNFSDKFNYSWLNQYPPTTIQPNFINSFVLGTRGYRNQTLSTTDPLSCYPTPTGLPGAVAGANPIARPAGRVTLLRETAPNVYTPVYEFGPQQWCRAYINYWGDFIYMGDMSQDMEPGNYRLEVSHPTYTSANPANGPFAEAIITYKKGTPTKKVIAGGLRIKKIRDFDPLTGKSVNRLFEYIRSDDPARSSGHLTHENKFLSIHQIPALVGQTYPIWHGSSSQGYGPAYSFQGYSIFNFVTLDVSNSTKVPTGISFSSPVTYDEVRESLVDDLGNNINGHTRYKMYSYNDPDCMDDIGLLSVSTRHYKRGLPKETMIFKKNGSLVSKDLYEYTDVIEGSPYFEYSKAFIGQYVDNVAFNQMFPALSSQNKAFVRNHFEEYELRSTAWKISKRQSILYDGGTQNPITNTTEYIYDEKGHLLANRIRSNRSDGRVQEQEVLYPADYKTLSSTSIDPAVNAIRKMKDLHINNTPIEKLTSIDDGTTKKVVGGVLNKFNIYTFGGKDQVLDKTSYGLEIVEPYTASTHVRSDNSTTFLAMDSRYKEKATVNQYDSRGIPLETESSGGKKQAILYGYDKKFVVAKATNTSVDEIAHTNFEFDHNAININGWDINNQNGYNNLVSFNGQYCYDLSLVGINSIFNTTLNPTKEYVVSLWSNGSIFPTVSGSTSVKQGETINGWTYLEYAVTGTNNVMISGLSKIDELRLFPKGAQMVTYTYDDDKGITSKCDANSMIQYYEYDDFNRLRLIRDKENNILKKIEYGIQQVD